MICYRKNLCRVTALLILKKILQKKRGTKRSGLNPGLCEVESSFATIYKLSFTQRILKITSGCQSNFTLQILLLKSGNKLQRIFFGPLELLWHWHCGAIRTLTSYLGSQNHTEAPDWPSGTPRRPQRLVILAFASPYQANFRMHYIIIWRMGQVVSKHSDAVNNSKGKSHIIRQQRSKTKNN